MELVEQVFSFIGSHLNTQIAPECFQAAVTARTKRASIRLQALQAMQKLLGQLMESRHPGIATSVAHRVAVVLQAGPDIDAITCSGLEASVRKAFLDTLRMLVTMCGDEMSLGCKVALCRLSIIPFSRADERGLAASRLLDLLDKLCHNATKTTACDSDGTRACSSLSTHRTASGALFSASPCERQAMCAWVSFRVLAAQCVLWQDEDGEEEDKQMLSRQMSKLLTNRLHERSLASNTNLKEVLQLLASLSNSVVGKEVIR
jgi:hypothetical protein